MNWVYTLGYWPVIIATAIIVYLKDRPRYFYYQNIIFCSFALSLIVFSTLPLGPPRLLTEFGFVDTIKLFGPAIYGSRDLAAYYYSFAAMPGLHIGWTLLLGVLLYRSNRAWLKFFGVAYPTRYLCL